MSEATRMFEEALDSLREDNDRLRKNLDTHIQIGADFAGLINEMLKYIQGKDKEDFLYFSKMVEKVIHRNRESNSKSGRQVL